MSPLEITESLLAQEQKQIYINSQIEGISSEQAIWEKLGNQVAIFKTHIAH